MGKAYAAPEIKEVKVMANQAIAACSVVAAGWQNSWQRDPNGYGSYDEALAVNPGNQWSQPDIFPIYHVEGTTSDGQTSSFNWEDQNSNGVYDSGDNIQCGVNRWYELDTSGLASGSAGSVTVS